PLLGARPARSGRFVRRLIAEGAVCVNGRPAAKGVRLAPGDRVTLPDVPASIAPEPQLALPILHEDDAVVALDKPGGMPGHALDPRQRGTAAAFLLARYPEMAGVGDPLAPGLVHRLEAPTRTGVTHQVRAHLAARGHPVLGDVLYGGAPAGLPPGRHALHAAGMTFPHPADGRPLSVRAALPAELAAFGA